jgi:uncharacterized protein (TIGR02466 family)
MAKPANQIEALFPTLIYRAEKAGPAQLNRVLGEAAWQLAREDVEGQRWCTRHGYPGYTSYATIDDLADRYPAFAKLEAIIARHAAHFAKPL